MDFSAHRAARSNSGVDRRLVSVASLSVFSMVLIGVLLLATYSPMKDDIAWLLYVARRWLAGRTLYQDLVEVNPPLIIWLSAIPSWLGQRLNVSPKFLAILLFIFQTTLSSFWAASILQRRGGIFSERWPVFSTIGTALLLLPGADFGQREHLLVAGFIPYLALFAEGLDGWTASRNASLAEGMCAGAYTALFCALKPLYAACFLILECMMLFPGRRLWRPMPIVAALTLCAYGLLVVVLSPAYLKQAVPMALALYGATDVSFGELLSDSALLLAGEVLAIGLLALRWRTMEQRNVMLVLLLFAATSTVVCFADGKDWYYHRIPATVSTVLALLLWGAAEIRQRNGLLRPPLLAAMLMVCVFCGMSVVQLQPEFQNAVEPRHSVVERLEDIIRAEHAHSYIALSEWIALGFPVVNNTGVTWASRFDSMWALRGEAWRKQFDQAAAKEWPIARWVAHDFIAGCPDIAVVDTQAPMDYIEVLRSADPAFARVWGRYKPIAAFHGLVVYRRALAGCLDVWVAGGVHVSPVTR